MAYKRMSRGGDAIDVIINFSGSDVEIDIPQPEGGHYKRIFDTGNIPTDIPDYPVIKTDRGYSARVYLPKFTGIITALDITALEEDR